MEERIIIDKHTQEALRQVATTIDENVQVVVERWGELIRAISKAIEPVLEIIGDMDPEDLPRPPAEIKKDIKYEKNPMRLRQLNKELNESYKAYKKRK